MFTDFLSTETLAMVLAGVAAFAGVVSLGLPAEHDTRLAARLRLVARERSQLQAKRLDELSAQTKAKLRHEAANLLKHVAALKAAPLQGSADTAARLRMAGFRGPGPEAMFMFLRTATPLALFTLTLAALTVWPGSGLSVMVALEIAVGAGFAGYGLPGFVLSRMIARRQVSILRAFPDALDLLLICVQSGMSVEAALAKVTKDITSQSIELAEEFSLTMAELAYLPSRWRAYHNLGERTGIPTVKLIAAALTQAERYGTSISQALTAAANECREGQIAEAERKAAALPPKLSVPLVVFFLPIVMVIILAPAVLKTRDVLKASGGHLTAQTGRQPDARNSQDAGVLGRAKTAVHPSTPETGE